MNAVLFEVLTLLRAPYCGILPFTEQLNGYQSISTHICAPVWIVEVDGASKEDRLAQMILLEKETAE
ncbi:hypothetical protein GOODEAATRI_018964 [Goodea atripinnis]|uniref:Uncharacterized protein n=1 Tax=Goodea atripinnis TaxID=208336 RepID=A0ABV0MKY3_9TELE